MSAIRYAVRIFSLACVVCLMSSCALFGRGEKSNSAPDTAVVESDAPADNSRDPAVLEARLRDLVAERTAAAANDAQSADVIHLKPYYLRQYEVYPGAADAVKIELSESESRATPYVANVTLEKVRFATKFHRKRADAMADGNFMRGTGEETLTYEYRNGRWVQVSSMFVAKQVEENVNGEWVPVKETVAETAAPEQEDRGFFGRMWSGITGRF